MAKSIPKPPVNSSAPIKKIAVKKSAKKIANQSEKKASFKTAKKGVMKKAAKKVASKSEPRSGLVKNINFQKALKLHHQGKLPEAWALYQATLKLDPRHFSAVHHMGLIAIQQQSYEMAVDLFKIAADIEPNNPNVHNNLANAYLKLGKTDSALKHYDSVLLLDSFHLDGLKNRAILLSGTEQYAKALADLAVAIKRYPKALDLYATIASIYIAQGSHLEALSTYKKALALDPHHPILNNNYGVLLCALKRYADAKIYLTKAIKAKKNYAQALNNRAVALIHLKQLAEARADYERAIVIDPEYQDAIDGLTKLKADLH
jgi:Tfp pilus assembly protein PilF